MTDINNIKIDLGNKEIIDVLKEPIQNLTLKPSQEFGNGIANFVHILVKPFEVLRAIVDYKVDTYVKSFQTQIQNKIEAIPENKRIIPKMNIIGPALEAAKYHLENEDIREMFANLIASSINLDNQDINHPAFIEIIKQLSPLEAEIFKHIMSYARSGNFGVAELQIRKTGEIGFIILMQYFFLFEKITTENYTMFDAAVSNLVRLQLIEVDRLLTFTDKSIYTPLKTSDFYKKMSSLTNAKGKKLEFVERYWHITMFGKNFAKVCL